MSAIIRIPSLLELSQRSLAAGTNADVKTALEITDFDPSTIEMDIENLQTDIADLSGSVMGLELDISNLDVSLTAAIVDERGELEAASTPANFSANFYLEVKDKNGIPIWIPAMSGAW